MLYSVGLIKMSASWREANKFMSWLYINFVANLINLFKNSYLFAIKCKRNTHFIANLQCFCM